MPARPPGGDATDLLGRFRQATGRDLLGLDDATIARGTSDRGAPARGAGRSAERGVLWLAEPVAGCLEGDVRGSGRRVYRTTVTLLPEAGGLRADIRCTCPIGRAAPGGTAPDRAASGEATGTGCKHGVALIDQWLRQRPATAGGADDGADANTDTDTGAQDATEREHRQRQQAMLWVRRLQSIPAAATPSTGDAAAGDPALDPAAGFRLYYVLVPERRRCRLRVFRLRRGPGGRLLSRADGDEHETADVPAEYPLLREAAGPAASAWAPVDRRVAASLAGADWQPGRGLALDAPHARAVLFDLARDGLLYLYRPPRHADEPSLALGEARPGTLTWAEIGSAPVAAAQLGLSVSGPGQVLYLAEPAWADRFSSRIGPLELPLSLPLLEWLRDAPVVPRSAAVDVATALQARRVARADLAARIPPLPGAAVREIHESPRPVLGLFLASAAPRRSPRPAAIHGKAWLVVSLAVEYAGQRVEPLRNPTVPLQLADGPALVVTDPAAERRLRDDLVERLEDLEDDEPLTLAGDAVNDPGTGRQGGRTGWLTVGSVAADSLTAVRIRHDLAPALRAEGWAVSDQADLPWRVLDLPAADDGSEPGRGDRALTVGLRSVSGARDGEPGGGPGETTGRSPGEAPDEHPGRDPTSARNDGRFRAEDWFEPTLGVRIGDRQIDLAPLLAEIVAAGGFEAWAAARAPGGICWVPVGPQTLLRLPVDRIAAFARQVAAWAEARPAGTTAGEKAGPAADAAAHATPHATTGPPPPRLGRLAAARLAATHGLGLPRRLTDLAEWLARHDGLAPVSPSPAFAATLRPYQCAGLGWLRFIADGEAGGILADDMGLGKTVQVLAHLDAERARGRLDRPALVVAPTSVVGNWAAEAARHAPALRTLTLTGPDRPARLARIGDGGHDLVLTSYALLPRDAAVLAAQPWHALVLDEAQWVKNSRTRAAATLRGLAARHRIALTGTPLENHLGELWSIVDLTMSGLLGDEAAFRRRFRLPIERARTSGDPARPSDPAAPAGPPGMARSDEAAIALGRDRLQALAERIRPFVLRRTKAEVLADLPPRTEITQRIELPDEQREFYEAVRTAMDRRVREALAKAGQAGGRARGQGRIVLLDALLKLRQVCCDPSLVADPAVAGPAAARGSRTRRPGRTDLPSGKRDALIELLVTLAAEARKALVFSQFTTMLDRIEAAIDDDPRLAGVARTRLDGDTADRAGAIDDFQRGDARIFLLSLKAGGAGLNLTAADTVILYDPWWNPAVERQAADRAHRIGQTQPVFVYRLIAAGTIEERIVALQAEKAELAEAVLAGSLTDAAASLSQDELLALLG